MTTKTVTLKKRSRNTSVNSKKSTWDKVKEAFVNNTISAAMAENPAIMTAAGWSKDAKTGKMTQKQTAATDKLAENLGIISMLADGDGLIKTGVSLAKAIRHPVRTAKAVVETVKSGIDLVKRGARSVNSVAQKTEDVVAKAARKAARKNSTLAKARRRVIKTTAEKARDQQRVTNGAETFSQKYPNQQSQAQQVSNNAAKQMRKKLKDSGNSKFTETYVQSSDVQAAKENFNKQFDEAIAKNAEYANETISQLVNNGVINANNTEYAKQLFNKYPEYAQFCREHKLNPELSSTIDQFMETQSRVTRGGNIKTMDANINIGDDKLQKINEAGEKMLSDNSLEAASKRTGGDRLNTNGLYTSNGYNMSDHYSRFNSTNTNGATPDNYGFMAILQDQLSPSQNLSLEQRLASRHASALNFDFQNSLEPTTQVGWGINGNYVSYLPKNQELKFRTSKFNFNKGDAPMKPMIENAIPVELGNLRDLPDVRYVESNYATRTGANFRNINERSYLPGNNLDIVSKEVSHNAPDIHGRYGFGGFPNNPEVDPTLFYQTVPSVVDRQRYYDQIFGGITPEIHLPNTRGQHLIRDYSKRQRTLFENNRNRRYDEYANLFDKIRLFENIKTNATKAGKGLVFGVVPSYAIYKYGENKFHNEFLPFQEQKQQAAEAAKYNSYINEAFNQQLHKLGEQPIEYTPISTDDYNSRLLEQIHTDR